MTNRLPSDPLPWHSGYATFSSDILDKEDVAIHNAWVFLAILRDRNMRVLGTNAGELWLEVPNPPEPEDVGEPLSGSGLVRRILQTDERAVLTIENAIDAAAVLFNRVPHLTEPQTIMEQLDDEDFEQLDVEDF